MDTQPTETRWHGTGFGDTAESAPRDHRRWWHIDCRDVANTRRDLDVLVNRDKVVLVGPAGPTAEPGSAAERTSSEGRDAAELSSGDASQLSMALRDAAAQARK